MGREDMGNCSEAIIRWVWLDFEVWATVNWLDSRFISSGFFVISYCH